MDPTDEREAGRPAPEREPPREAGAEHASPGSRDPVVGDRGPGAATAGEPAAADAGSRGRRPGGTAVPVGAIVVRLLIFAVLGVLCFPPLPFGPLGFVALVPLIDAVRLAERAAAAGPRSGRRASACLYLGGALFFLLLLHWLLFVPPEEVTVPGLMIAATAAAGLYLGLFVLLAQALARRAWRLGVPLWIAVPVAWVGTEYLRTTTQLGCPWGLLGYALTSTPALLQLASWIGIFGVSLVVALVNGLVHAAWRQRRRRFAIAAVAIVALLGLHGGLVIATAPPVDRLEVALVQGNIGHEIKFKRRFRMANIRRMITLSRLAIDPASNPTAADTLLVGEAHGVPDLVVWPETAAPCHLRREIGCRIALQDFVDDSRVPLFTGYPDLEPVEDGGDRHWNAAGLFLPDVGQVGRYNKVNLVPFGEAIPYQERIRILERIDFGEADFSRGAGFEPLRFEPGDFGAMICFESIFPEAGRTAARRGAEFFVNITNDEWFGRSAGPYQHAAMAIVRSIENRRGLVRCANTGLSFVVDRHGRTSRMTPLYVPRVVRGRVDLGRGTTTYMRIGDVVPRACLLVALVLGVAGWRRPARAG